MIKEGLFWQTLSAWILVTAQQSRNHYCHLTDEETHLREVKLLVQGHTAKLRAEPGPRSISRQSLLYSVISKCGVFIHKRKRLPAQGAIVRVEDETGSQSEW